MTSGAVGPIDCNVGGALVVKATVGLIVGGALVVGEIVGLIDGGSEGAFVGPSVTTMFVVGAGVIWTGVTVGVVVGGKVRTAGSGVISTGCGLGPNVAAPSKLDGRVGRRVSIPSKLGGKVGPLGGRVGPTGLKDDDCDASSCDDDVDDRFFELLDSIPPSLLFDPAFLLFFALVDSLKCIEPMLILKLLLMLNRKLSSNVFASNDTYPFSNDPSLEFLVDLNLPDTNKGTTAQVTPCINLIFCTTYLYIRFSHRQISFRQTLRFLQFGILKIGLFFLPVAESRTLPAMLSKFEGFVLLMIYSNV